MEESANRERMESLAQQMSDVLEDSDERFIIVSNGEDMAAQVRMTPRTLLGALVVMMRQFPFIQQVITAAMLGMEKPDDAGMTMENDPEATVQ